MSIERWSEERAWNWYRQQPWLVGCNFTPSTAINQLEMWQAETFDPATIERELQWASDIGMNVVRVYLHDIVWEHDREGFIIRIKIYLNIASSKGIRTMFTIFDDCWNDTPQIGKQPEPIPETHNSGWVQSPGQKIVNDPSAWERLERYVKGLLRTFGQDERIVAWDLYNEPGNRGQGTLSLPLLQRTFEWARENPPVQPLTAGLWFDNAELNAYQLAASDIITFHDYHAADHLARQIMALKAYQRPLICTEWLRRDVSIVLTNLPIFKGHQVGCINWGLVSGKTNTIYPWQSDIAKHPKGVWFHDLFRPDGTPYDAAEIEVFKTLTGKK